MHNELACLAISDLHYGKQTPTFTPDICRKRMDKLADRIIHIVKDIQVGHVIEELVICCLGDVNDGTDIYAGQANYQAIANVEQQARELAEYLAGWTRKLAVAFPRVRWEVVPGNHGRAGRWAHEAANWDMVCYRYLEMLLKPDEGVAVNLPKDGVDPFIRQVDIGGHKVLIYHGHDVRTYSNIPWYGMMLRIARWATTQKLSGMEVAMMGHFHSFGLWDINQIPLFVTGTMVSDDEWALRTFGWQSANKWHLFGVSKKYIPTWHYDLRLGNDG